MQISVLNERARRKYSEFVCNIVMVAEALDSVSALIGQMTPCPLTQTRWSVPAAEEVEAARKRAFELLEGLRTRARSYEAELVSRDWRL